MTGPAAIIYTGTAWVAPAIAAAVALAAALVWALRGSSTERWVRLVCALLKVLGVAALVWCILDPMAVSQRARPGANFFALMADNSQSLRIKDPGATESRGEIVRQTLTGDPNGWRSALEENFQVRRYYFDSRLQSTRDFGELNFDGHASAIGNALRTAAEHWRGQPVAGVLLFTDGISTDSGAEPLDLSGLPPVYPVIAGTDGEIKDLAVRKVNVSQTAFEDAPVTIQAEVAATGFPGANIVTRVTEVAVGGMTIPTNNAAVTDFHLAGASNIVAQSTERAADSDATLNFRFQVQPDQPGLHFYEVETRVREDAGQSPGASQEATLVNNRQMVVVDRGQQPLRVLYVTGQPNWEFKFLHRAIADDPQVHLVALFRVARREPKFVFRGRAGESSNPMFRGFDHPDEETPRYDQPVNIPAYTRDPMELRGGFPKTAEQLFQYDGIIIDDVEAEYFTHEQMELMQRFVAERGGGLMMLGGADSFREGNYAGTPVASVLPVYLDRPVEAHLPGEFRFSLTPEGWLEPWTRLRPTAPEEKSRIESMPAFEVFNPVAAAKPGATVMATATDTNGETFPALVVQRFGYGRSAAQMIGDYWRYGFGDPDLMKDRDKSWRQLVRWLVADVPARVEVAAETGANGDPARVRLTVKARDEEYKPLDGAVVQLKVRPVRLQPQEGSDSPPDTNIITLTAEPSTSAPGSYEATYIARNAGAYAVEALVTESEGKVVGRSATGWTCDPGAEEFRTLKPNRALLESIAKQTGGEVVAAADLEKFVRRLPERRTPIMETWTRPLWHKPAVLLFVLACFVTEWGLRRWKGLP